MGETTRQIETHIERTREDLGSNLQELEHKVKAVTDWRQQFRHNPMTMVGAAFGGGVLLATMLAGRKRSRYRASASEPHAPSSTPHAATDRQKQKALEAWDNIKGALIGVAATQFKSVLGEIVPGFQAQLRQTENETTRSSVSLASGELP
jgi:hypothetical protein